MSRLNIFESLKQLNLPLDLHANAYRLIATLESPMSYICNPLAASTLRELLKEVQFYHHGNHQRLEYLAVLFLGQIETLLMTCMGGVLTDKVGFFNLMEGIVLNLHDVAPITKADFQERIDSLLFGRPKRKIYPMESYNPKVSFVGSTAGMMVHSSVMGYLRATPDFEARQRKLDFLRRKVDDEQVDEQTRYLCIMLSNALHQHLKDDDTSKEDSFAIIFRKLMESAGLKDESNIINDCIKARNYAVHEGTYNIRKYGLRVLRFYLLLLFNSEVAISSENEIDSRSIEEYVRREVAKDIRNEKITKALGIAVNVAIVALLAWFAATFITSAYMKDTEIRQVRWTPTYSQLNARINEAIATKDTTQIIDIHDDLKWIDENILK